MASKEWMENHAKADLDLDFSETKLHEAAKELANVDFKINGNYINAPYTLHFRGCRYKVRVRRHEGEKFHYLEIVKPETVHGTVTLG